jgi:hypothetical protein
MENQTEPLLIPVTESFKDLLIENNYAITEMGEHENVMIYRAEREFEKMTVSFYFYINPFLKETKYTIIKKIPVEIPDKNEKN